MITIYVAHTFSPDSKTDLNKLKLTLSSINVDILRCIYFPGMIDKHTVPIMCAFVFTEGYPLNRSFSKVGTLSLANDLSSGVYFFYASRLSQILTIKRDYL